MENVNWSFRSNFLFVYSVVVTALLAMMYTALVVKAEGSAALAVDSMARVGGPLAAAFVAWLGVDRTLRNSRRLETLKEWHQDLRWACEMAHSGKGQEALMGLTILDALDGHPDLEDAEQRLIDAAIMAVEDLYE